MARRAPLEFYDEPLPGVDCSELQGKLIAIEGPDSVGRSTQVAQLRFWLEQQGHAVIDTGMARSELTKKGIQQAKQGHTLGPTTMTLFYTTDFADRLENEVIPALRAGFVVLTDRYIFSIMARAIARGQDRKWIEQVAGIALVPHRIYYLRAEIDDLIARVVVGRGAFEYWESGMDIPIGRDRYDSFVRYQGRVIKALDEMAEPYNFTRIDASKPPDQIFRQLQKSIGRIIGVKNTTDAGEVLTF
ncbi:MAG: thymidylate kinase [Acidobacteria bacterium]|nr:thymidylate kinase [Acidobacteriota bacterium]